MEVDISDLELPNPFSGIVRLFPLPNLVVFPGVIQPLHIFEERYRKMTDDCLAADQLMTLCLPNDQKSSSVTPAEPEVYDTVCICKIAAHAKLDDGRYNIVVVGMKRAEIIRELSVEQPYRMAEVGVLEETLPDADRSKELKENLIVACQEAALLPKLIEQLEKKNSPESEFSLSLLVDLVSFTVQLDCLQRLAILESPNVEVRCKKLIEFLSSDQIGENNNHFPPGFSLN